MQRVLWLVALLGLTLAVCEVRAQGVVVVNPGAGFFENTVLVGGTDVGFSLRRRHLALSIHSSSFSSYSIGYYNFSSYLAGPGYMIWERPGFTAVVVQQPPPFVPFFGPGLDANQRAAEWVARQRSMLDPVAPKEGPIIVKVEPKDPPKVVRPDAPKDPIPAPERKVDPKEEAVRLVRLGRDAYAQQGYGRAVQRFRQATETDPANTEAQFLLGEALFAIGKYREAADTIQRGLVLDPNWPNQIFRPLELYGANVADYSDHLFMLETILKAQPNDADLLFLMGYQRWFDGRKDEARTLFLQALRQGAKPAGIQPFLNVAPRLPAV